MQNFKVSCWLVGIYQNYGELFFLKDIQIAFILWVTAFSKKNEFNEKGSNKLFFELIRNKTYYIFKIFFFLIEPEKKK